MYTLKPFILVSFIWISAWDFAKSVGFLRGHYEGCYYYDNLLGVRDHHFQLGSDYGSVDECLHGCINNGFIYAGLRFYNYWFCQCGNTLNSDGRTDESQCTTPCRDNPSQICGGGLWLSVYKAACSPGYWDIRNHQYPCDQQCGRCAGDADCDDYNGECPTGCQVGWTELKCNREATTTKSTTTSTTTISISSTTSSTFTPSATTIMIVTSKTDFLDVTPVTIKNSTDTTVSTTPNKSEDELRENSSVNVVLISVVVVVVVLVIFLVIGAVVLVVWVKKTLKKQTDNTRPETNNKEQKDDRRIQENHEAIQETGFYDEIRDVEEGGYVNVEMREDDGYEDVTVTRQSDANGRESYQALDITDVTSPTPSVYASLSD